MTASNTCAYTSSDGPLFRASRLTRGPWHPEHPHAGQTPEKIDIAALNRKNSVLVKKVA